MFRQHCLCMHPSLCSATSSWTTSGKNCSQICQQSWTIKQISLLMLHKSEHTGEGERISSFPIARKDVPPKSSLFIIPQGNITVDHSIKAQVSFYCSQISLLKQGRKLIWTQKCQRRCRSLFQNELTLLVYFCALGSRIFKAKRTGELLLVLDISLCDKEKETFISIISSTRIYRSGQRTVSVRLRRAIF